MDRIERCKLKNVTECLGELSLGQLRILRKKLDTEIKWAKEEQEVMGVHN